MKQREFLLNLPEIWKLSRLKTSGFWTKKSKLNEKMLKQIKDFLFDNGFISFTLNDLQLYWTRKTAEHSVVYVSTMGLWLRNKFDMSYKKLSKIHP